MKVALCLLMLFCSLSPAEARNYTVSRVSERSYAAIANPAGPVSSNAFFVVTPNWVILAGSHFSAEAIAEITAAVAEVTPLPIRYVVITHHHRGYNNVDFDFPSRMELVVSAQTWQALRSEYRQIKNPVLVFDRELILRAGGQEIFVTNMGTGHDEGNSIVFLPDQWVLFASDLLFNDEAGYMAGGDPLAWVTDLQTLENMSVARVVPGRGEVTDPDGIRRFRAFFQEFLTEVLGHVEKGENAAETVRRFKLPKERLPRDFSRYRQQNIEWAWRELKNRQ